MGKILRIDMTNKTYRVEETNPADDEKYIGGAGVSAAIFTKEVAPTIDPLSPENRLIFSVGPFCGTLVPFCGRHFVMAKSPLTNMIGEASSGGFFGKELKCTGYDHVVIMGKSDKPVYLWITNDVVEFRDAEAFWKKGTLETEALLKQQLGDENVKIASIGIAGVNLVKYASIMNEENRAAGRCGLGAVMGSKNLKAIAVRGKGQAPTADKTVLLEHTKNLHELVKQSPLAGVYKMFGTPTGVDSMAGVGDVPIKNFTEGRWNELKNIGAEALKTRGEIKHHACFNCPVACTGLVQYKEKWVRWPEYENLCALGSNLMVSNLETIIKWSVLVNDLGMDSISLGVTIACYLNAIESNKIPPNTPETGIVLDATKNLYNSFGNMEAIEKLINLIGNRQGIGNDLAEGVKVFCKKYNLPPEFETHVKGLEVPMHQPQANNMTSLDYATTPRGAFHCYMPMHLSTNMNLKKEVGLDKMVDRFGVDDCAIAVKKMQDVSEAYSAANGCIFGFSFISEITPWVNCLNAITGRKYTVESWAKAGENIINLKREYNLKCGTTKADDKLCPRFLTPILKGGTRKNVPQMDGMLKKYYEIRNW